MNSLFYDINRTYEENYKRGPVGLAKLKRPSFKKAIPKFKFLGFPVNIPFGIPAGPLLNSKFVKEAFDFGFSINTYKTVRNYNFPCHPFPNVVFVDAPKKLNPLKTSTLKVKHNNTLPKKISITNSFGVPSKKPEIWQEDIRKALFCVKAGELLILSFMGTAKPNQTQQEFIDNFVNTAKFASETGVKVLEVNLSCPNIGNEGLVCYDLNTTEKILRAIRKVINNTSLLIKVGYYKNAMQMEKIAELTNEYANGVCLINTIQAKIVDKNGNQVLPGKNRLYSGVCGDTIRWAGIEMVKKLSKIRKKRNYNYEIVGIGGVMTKNDYLEYRKVGADVVQSATGAMWNPYLAYEIWKLEQKKQEINE